MANDLKFIGWKTVELVSKIVGFPFFFVGAWLHYFSGICGDRAMSYRAHK